MFEPRYDHQKTEPEIYKHWEESGYFDPDRLPPISADSRRQHAEKRGKIQRQSASSPRKSAFTIIMPPPNANGSLHVGHAVFVTLQDLMIRFQRMRGKKALWLPGADHAGFETWVVFDKKLEKEGRNKFEIDRQQLFNEIWDFTQNNKKTMEDQLRKLGASCDWSREKFTLDPDIVKVVYETFGKLYNDGLIYRGERIVNWCPKHQTSLSDIENQFQEQTDPFYYLTYGPFTIGTVRPETKFGDKYVVMHPDDKRYKEYAPGQKITLEWINGPITATVVKDKTVDMKFGTGVMTITPWHDDADFEIAERHKLDKEQIIDFQGKLLPIAGEFAGMHIKNARPLIVEKLKAKGLLAKVDPDYTHSVRVCYKCKTPIEPQIKTQWFIKMTAPLPKSKKSLRDLGVDAVKKKKIKIVPKRTEAIFLNWMKSLRDWNISRQIVWGIRIPAWFCFGSHLQVQNPRGACSIKMDSEIKARWFLIRHGETDWNKKGRTQGHADVPLNEEGRRQAREAGKILKTKNIDLIISSDLVRCRATAEIIAEATGAEIILDDQLRERHLGITQGMLRSDRNAMYGDVLYSYEGKPPDGESFKELEERVWKSFGRHKKSHRHKNIVMVTHGGPVRMILKNLKKWDFEQTSQRKTVENAEIIELAVSDPCSTCGNDLYEQDPDVFDTWFSSGQWPFATLLALSKKDRGSGIGDRSKQASNSEQRTANRSDFATYYPTDVMETGYDILLIWVAKMIMLGLYRTGKIPFKTVYLNGLVLDKDRQKVSKSKGNVIDPLGIAEIYGADALRMALVAGNTAGRDIIISEDKIRGYRNFATKLWNVARFILLNKPSQTDADNTQTNAEKSQRKSASGQHKSAFTSEDKKNLKELLKIKSQVAKHIEQFEFHLAAEKIYHYIWHTFADKIIEEYKPRLRESSDEQTQIEKSAIAFSEPRFSDSSDRKPLPLAPTAPDCGRETKPVGAPRASSKAIADANAAYQTLETILLESLKMLHPFMPFVTEEIFQKFRPGELLMVEKW